MAPLGTPAWKVGVTIVLFAVAMLRAALWAAACLRAVARLGPTSAPALRLTVPLTLAGLALAARAGAGRT
jgi:hypothetical protein